MTDVAFSLDAERYAPELAETAAFRNASDLARQMLGPETVPTGMHAIRKPGTSVPAPPARAREA